MTDAMKPNQRALDALAGLGQTRCLVCHKVIVKEAHGGPHPSPGDHDPAYHVAAAYGTWHPSLGSRP